MWSVWCKQSERRSFFDGLSTGAVSEADSRVIVIGAGVAGLSAARVLLDDGCEACVLDGRECIGGNLNMIAVGDGSVDDGGNWIQGALANPLHHLPSSQDSTSQKTTSASRSSTAPQVAPVSPAKCKLPFGELRDTLSVPVGPHECGEQRRIGVMRLHGSLAGGPFPKAAAYSIGRELPFSVEEYRDRVTRARALMSRNGLDALIVMNPASVFYLSGFQTFAVDGGTALVISHANDPAIVMDPPEFGGALLSVWFDDTRGYPPETDRPPYVASMLAEFGVNQGRIGTDDASFGQTAAFRNGLERALPRAEITSATELLIELKRSKSEGEIECIRWAALATRAAMESATATVEPGATDGDVAGAAYQAMTHAGGEYPCLSPIVTSGLRSGILHSTHKRRTIEAGDNVLLEIGGCYQRYSAPQMRTVSARVTSDDVRRAADACVAALNAVLNAARPGILARDLAEVGWSELEAAGEDLIFHGNFGYGIGAGFPPNWADGTGLIERNQNTPLEAGMVFHHPIAVRRLGEFGVAFSETSVITSNGCTVLTHGGRSLIERT